MIPVLIELWPVIIGAAVLPIMVIIVLLILASEGGTSKGVMFVLGVFLMRFAQGLIFGFLLRPAESSASDDGTSWILSTLLLVLGTLMLVAAFKTLVSDVDPDAPPPKWMAMLDGLTNGKAFLMGVGLTAIAIKIWLFAMAAVGTITRAGLGTAEALLTFAAYALLSVTLIALPVLAAIIAPSWADTNLGRLSDWMGAHNRAISITVSLLFGVIFFYKGITGLMG